MTSDHHFFTIAEAADLIEQKKLSPVELTQMLLDRIEALEPQLDSFITRTPELAIQKAREAEAEIAAGKYRGPMHGIPFGLKDIYSTAGILTSGHSKTAIDNIPAEDATATAQLHAAGAILMGKLATHEFAHGGPSFDLPWPPARNPWNREHFTGGSSSGSGAAIAAGFVLGAMGSDTGGSIRGPAAFCGIAGIKPTYGLVSRKGVLPNSYSYDHCGPMAWTAEDCAIMLQPLARHDPGDPASARVTVPDYRAALTGDIRGMRIGVIRHFHEEDLKATDEVCAAVDAALDVFRSLGAVIEDVRLAPLQDYSDVKIVLGESELFSIHRPNLISRPGDYGADFLERSLPACLFGGFDVSEAQRRRRVLIEEMQPVYARFDLLITAGAPGPAPRLDAHRSAAFWQRPNLTSPFNVTGAPAISICSGFSATGLPLSIQLAGRPFEETTVLNAAYAYEQATTWRSSRPGLVEGPFGPGSIPVHTVPPITLDAETRVVVESHAAAAGLSLTEEQFALLADAAPHALAMAQRLRSHQHGWGNEPASILTISPWSP